MSLLGEKQLDALQALVNQALVLDPLAQQSLQQFAGQRFRIEITEPVIDVLIQVVDQSIQLSPPDEEACTTHLQGNLTAFVKLLSAEDKAAALINSDVKLIGDSQPLIELQKLLVSIELDWEYHIAKLMGDLPAHMLGRIGRGGHQWVKSSQPVFMRHLQEFIQEEAKLSPSNDELDRFVDAVQDCGERIERVQARVKRLQSTLSDD